MFIGISSLAVAQIKNENKFSLQIDTLQLYKKNYQDSTKIKSYLDHIFDNFRTDIGNSIAICDYLYNRSKEIKNPYYGNEMLECGRVAEEIKAN